MKKLFLEINTIIASENYNSAEELVFEKDVIHNLYRINNQLGYSLVFIIDNETEIDEAKESFITKNNLAGWDNVYKNLKSSSRKIVHTRSTNETQVAIELNIDGSGTYNVETELNFFDHMLEQFSKHSLIDLNLKVKGDLHIDEHHTIEDTAIALGEAIVKALGNKKGMERYGFLLPMDDCLAQVAIDFGGRSWLVWDAEFKREYVGDVPTEMFFHFFKSFSDAAKCNLNIKAEGENEHHKIESIFKAFSKAVKMAVAVNENSDVLPTTKGVL
jgi:imidazoleglycerol-phosphate dehydratase / histidinol-phosphatase